MSKRRASSPIENPITKKPSMSAIAAATAYSGKNIPVKDVQSRKTIRTVQASTTQLKEPSKASILQPKSPNRQPLKAYGPWERASTANLRSTKTRSSIQLSPVREQQPATTSAPFKPGLTLSTHPLQTTTPGGISLTSLLLFPTTLAALKPTTPSTFTFNLTPQLGPSLPDALSASLYTQYVCSSPLLRPGKLPYLHLGSTTLSSSSTPNSNPISLHFHLILPNAGGPPHACNTGHLSDQQLQLFHDAALLPALETADPSRSGPQTWMQAMTSSAAQSRNFRPTLQTESLHCFHLPTIWNCILEFADEDDDLATLLDGHILIAYADGGKGVEWSVFQKVWNASIDVTKLGRESRVDVGMCLELDLGEDEEVRKDREKRWDGVRRVRR